MVAIMVALLCAITGVTEEASMAEIIDMHVHVAGIGAGDSGIHINEAMQESWRFPVYLRAFGVTREHLEAGGDTVLLEHLNAEIKASVRVSKAVVLAMDGVINEEGKLDRNATQIYVPNEFLARELPRFEHLLFGASVNPYRHDALERLEEVKSQGAVLIKWLPNIMYIDPADPELRAFYETMVELDLPLLTHAGRERAFANARDELGDPARLALPLEIGVRVIAAHVGTDGETDGEANFARILPLFKAFPNLYADISSLTQINKLGHLRQVLAHPELENRLIYGSDWPLQFFPLVSPFYHLGDVPVSQASEIARIDNQWDRDVALKEAMGVPDAVFHRSAEALNLR
ncbi:MAG: amidohydrolase family protein [Gammaproteobacteria bacterium]|nr:amidohydrolase family protein [Gammaproteobacteria bacterium]